eukprot:356894-Chlamydomonas_euryale.AAC.1
MCGAGDAGVRACTMCGAGNAGVCACSMCGTGDAGVRACTMRGTGDAGVRACTMRGSGDAGVHACTMCGADGAGVHACTMCGTGDAGEHAPCVAQAARVCIHARTCTGKPVVPVLVGCCRLHNMPKIPLEKGYSQMDWLRLTQRDPNLNGLDGKPLRQDISMAELRKHKSPDDAWMVLNDLVRAYL